MVGEREGAKGKSMSTVLGGRGIKEIDRVCEVRGREVRNRNEIEREKK